jgi:2-iminobutanoate/2-iminopropanoate deaminase
MTRRRVLEVEGVSHRAPIPMGVEIGGLVFSSAIAGRDPATGELPPDPARQAELVFDHARALLAAAGTGPEAVARMTVYVRDDAYREDVNREWLKMFPDEHDRPARHILRWDLQDGMLIQCELVALLAPR